MKKADTLYVLRYYEIDQFFGVWSPGNVYKVSANDDHRTSEYCVARKTESILSFYLRLFKC